MYSIHWFRRDLRLFDNHSLFRALSSGKPTKLVFIFDRDILDKLDDSADARVHFIHNQILDLNLELNRLQASIEVYYGKPASIWEEIINQHPISEVYANEDYEPYAIQRLSLIHI